MNNTKMNSTTLNSIDIKKLQNFTVKGSMSVLDFIEQVSSSKTDISIRKVLHIYTNTEEEEKQEKYYTVGASRGALLILADLLKYIDMAKLNSNFEHVLYIENITGTYRITLLDTFLNFDKSIKVQYFVNLKD